MTDFYLDDAATGADTGADWANAFITVAQLLASAFAAGDRVFIANTHSETVIAGLTFPGTLTAPNEIYSVDNTGSPEPPDDTDHLAGALLGDSGILSVNGSFYMRGMFINAGNATTSSAAKLKLASASAAQKQHYENCDLSSQANNGAADFSFGPTTDSGSVERSTIILTDCVLGLGHVSQHIIIGNCDFKWRNKEGTGVAFDITSARHANPNLELFNFETLGGKAESDGLDLSNLSTLDGIFGVNRSEGTLGGTINNCKLNPTFALVTGTRAGTYSGNEFSLFNCDDGDTNYLFEFDGFAGNIVTDIAKALNATDGTTAFSWKMVSSADADFFFPLYTPWIPVWVDSTGAKTVTMEFLHDGGVTDLNDDEVWIEVMYALNTADPLYGLVTDRMVPLATPAAQTDSIEGDWTEDLANENAQKAVTASITVNEKGLIWARLALAKPSQTIWMDPKPLVT